jgi:hypothetical protein
MAVNFWLECVIDAFLRACAEGRNWQEECAVAEQAARNAPLVILTQEDLKTKKGIAYSRQHLHRRVKRNTFPPPFKFPENPP